MALRLARFNARIDVEEQPHKSAGFLTGVPAPAGAGVMLLPIFLWLVTGSGLVPGAGIVVVPWALFVAFLMISSVATYSWSSIRIRRDWRLFALAGIAMLGAALVTAPWETLARDRAPLPGDDPVQHGELCEGQAAARQRGSRA